MVICEHSRQAMAVDPLEADELFDLAQAHDAKITHIVNTHGHHDHVAGNVRLASLTGADVYAHHLANVPAQTQKLDRNDVINVGVMKFRVLFTPGHTENHICLLAQDPTGLAHLFSGDTLFNACAGNCYNGGNVIDMYNSFATELAKLADNTKVYPGHDYMKNNLAFAALREPSNAVIQEFQDQVSDLDGDQMPVMSMFEERQYNPFLRVNQVEIRQQLLQDCPEFLQELTGKDTDTRSLTECEVFQALRHLRDQW